jgi:hypothetical protein
MDPVINRLNTTLPDSPRQEPADQHGKSGPSNFDKVKSQLNTGADNQQQPTGPQSPANASAVGNGPTVDRAQRDGSVTPSDRVEQSLSAGGYHLARLRERVEATPGANSISGLQSRLSSIERQYARLDATAQAMPANASPQQWIALQQQVYSMNESIGVLSKMVTQAASGVKSVLQTQV